MSEDPNTPATRSRSYTLQRQRPPDTASQAGLAAAPGGAASQTVNRRKAKGLSIASYCHKNPSSESAPPPEPLLLSYYQGASLVDLPGPSFTAALPASTPSKRQQIGDWSQASRTRFRLLLNTLRKDALDQALVLTLTYPHDFPPPEQFATYKNHLRTFNQALKRRFPACSGVWKLEFQRRGAAHFHILCFGLHNDDLDSLRTWITSRWYALAHNGDKHQGSAACELRPIMHHGGFINYLASYLGKSDQTRPGDFTGRYWGTFARTRLPVGELHTLELTPQQWAKVRRLARKKFENDINHRRWSLFFKNVNPRKPAPGPEYGILSKHPSIFGNRLFWDQLKSAFHGGARRLRAWHWMGREEVEYEGSLYWTTPGYGYGVTATSIVPGYRPPSRYKARHLDRVRLICNATGFIQAIQRGIQQGLI